MHLHKRMGGGLEKQLYEEAARMPGSLEGQPRWLGPGKSHGLLQKSTHDITMGCVFKSHNL